MKVIFLAYANNATSPLEYLTEEDEKIIEILSDRYASGDYLIHRESFATPETINKYLGKYRDNLAIFHYSGHAGHDRLLLNNGYAFSDGIAQQLKYSAEKGSLKLVILNGCSTQAQVIQLMKNKVPVVVSTSAPVNDRSAKEFSIRFWERLVKNELSVAEAYAEAIGTAATVTAQPLGNASEPHLFIDNSDLSEDTEQPLWRLDSINDEVLRENPVPFKEAPKIGNSRNPNEDLIETLYQSFHEAENPQVTYLWEQEQSGNNITESAKQIAIVNSIPFPIGIHLQKLICPTTDIDDEGYDSYGIRRLNQIAQLYQITTEFLGIIVIAQTWEISLRYPDDFVLDRELKNKLKEYTLLDEKKREVYNYIPLIHEIRKFLDNIQPSNKDLKSFVEEQEILKDLFHFDDDFRGACKYLSSIRERTINNRIDENRVVDICIEAERQLCIFVKPLGFIHRYHLTSIQNIDILKLRHIARGNTEYKHRIIRCMQAIGKDEWNYYYMETFLDNWGVILLKCDVSKIPGKKKFKVKVKDYLNLSPFVIDRNSFIDRADLAYIMFFKGEDEKNINFKRVKNPLNQRDSLPVRKAEDEEDNFDAIRLQYNAFKQFIA